MPPTNILSIVVFWVPQIALLRASVSKKEWPDVCAIKVKVANCFFFLIIENACDLSV